MLKSYYNIQEYSRPQDISKQYDNLKRYREYVLYYTYEALGHPLQDILKSLDEQQHLDLLSSCANVFTEEGRIERFICDITEVLTNRIYAVTHEYITEPKNFNYNSSHNYFIQNLYMDSRITTYLSNSFTRLPSTYYSYAGGINYAILLSDPMKKEILDTILRHESSDKNRVSDIYQQLMGI